MLLQQTPQPLEDQGQILEQVGRLGVFGCQIHTIVTIPVANLLEYGEGIPPELFLLLFPQFLIELQDCKLFNQQVNHTPVQLTQSTIQ